jgi:hypothetical protein
MAGLPVGAGVGGLGQAVAGGYRHSLRSEIVQTFSEISTLGEHDRHVALKDLQPGQVGAPAARARLFDEARITGRLEHPGGVPVYELARECGGGGRPT